MSDIWENEGGTPEPEPASSPSGTVHVALDRPWHVWIPGGDLPSVDFDGLDVSESLAEQLVSAAERDGIRLRKDNVGA